MSVCRKYRKYDDASYKNFFEHLIGLPFIDIFGLYFPDISYLMNRSGTT